MTVSLFTYGTLMLPEVLEAVTGRTFPWQAAMLEGHARYRVRTAVFPALIPMPGERVEGRLFDGVDRATLERLDRYEGNYYERRQLHVQLESRTTCPAHVYIFKDCYRSLLILEPWSLEIFRRERLDSYLAAH